MGHEESGKGDGTVYAVKPGSRSDVILVGSV